ncbi:Polyketide cyclase/dehydrase and lipid transport superfamily protein [Melia azedarach]|uniref:Polyketide cyclase/dehydrase and lipid transport superfamily protein n=1 Tax=Melia azedarach TaxID=155640 RepID=A0ACC1YQI5_MELAZ|nr:Polyketide cyclase/dehydrase and lipid transport superfamily protein [Melia azedarach]
MGKFWISPSSYEFWNQNTRGGYATLIALFFILIYHFFKRCLNFFASRLRSSSLSLSSSSSYSAISVASRPDNSQSRLSEIVSDEDLKFLIDNLDHKHNENEKWENVIDKRNNLLSYSAKCCRPTDGPLKYLSVTVFENCSPENLKDFYMDNDYRIQWDKTLVEHKQLQVDETNGTEIGRTIKKFPLLTPREYVLAWRLWEGRDKSFYCFIKDCEHPLAPQQKKYVRVKYFRSGWHIQKVPGRDACEIKMFHQENAGLNVEMAKLAFAKGIWSYVCKMDNALRKYSIIQHPQTSPAVSAVSLIQKVPVELEAVKSASSSESPAATAIHGVYTGEAKGKKLTRRPSKKLVANGLLLLGGAICLSRGHSALGAKVAMAYILTKLHKRGPSSGQTGKA